MKKPIVGVVGCGVIGRSWAIVFARAGAEVRLFDAQPGVAARSIDAIRRMLLALDAEAESICERLSASASLEAALDRADYVQESVGETVEIKHSIFETMDMLAPPQCILASSCSSIPPDEFLSDITGVHRCLIAHPFNPPHLIPVVEVVPATKTSGDVTSAARRFLKDCGQYPVLLKKPEPGFIGNRLQTAVASEVMNLIAQDVASPADIDACLRLGLGLRWALMGPLETMDLNADGGIAAYIGKFGDDYQALARQLGVANPWTQEAVAKATDARRAALPLDGLPDRMAWRDRALLEIKNVVMRARNEEEAPREEAFYEKGA